MQFTAVSCYLVRLRPKYIPEHPIVKSPQPFSLSVESVDIMLKAVRYGVLHREISELCSDIDSLRRILKEYET
jgi:Ni,Fe-hydrogenase III large subunit